MAKRREVADEDGDPATGNRASWPLKLSEPLKTLAQINVVVTVIAGRAEMLAEQHNPAQAQELKRFVQQYEKLVATLVGMLERKGHRE